MKSELKARRRLGLLILFICSCIYVLFGSALAASKPMGMLDFRALYYSASCLLHNCDPYNVRALQTFYRNSEGMRPHDPQSLLYATTVFINLPSIFTVTTPFAVVSWETAKTLWMILTAGCFTLASFATWKLGEVEAPLLSACLLGFSVANAEISLASGNAAGLVVSLCALSFWCFFTNRLVPIGVLCLSVSLAMKPHDVALVWLYLLLAGDNYRKRAWQTLLVSVVLALAPLIIFHEVAPSWMQELESNMATYFEHGGANDPRIAESSTDPSGAPGPSVFPAMVCDLQTVIATFENDPKIYNPITYLICTPLLFIWAFWTFRSHPLPANTFLALAAIIPFSMVITYHRTTDTKLLMLTVPACAMLWNEGRAIRWWALAFSTASIVITGDIPLAMIGMFIGRPDWAAAGFLKRILLVVLIRPVPLVLLAMGIFYLWLYVRRARPRIPLSKENGSRKLEVATADRTRA